MQADNNFDGALFLHCCLRMCSRYYLITLREAPGRFALHENRSRLESDGTHRRRAVCSSLSCRPPCRASCQVRPSSSRLPPACRPGRGAVDKPRFQRMSVPRLHMLPKLAAFVLLACERLPVPPSVPATR